LLSLNISRTLDSAPVPFDHDGSDDYMLD
jgi:hypothetical protein